MKNILTIIKKEFARFFKDRRMIITVLLPGVLIYALYSLMGTVFEDMSKPDTSYVPTAIVVDLPQDLAEPVNAVFKVSEENVTAADAQTKVAEGSVDIAIIYIPVTEQNGKPEVRIFYNSVSDNSSTAYMLASGILEAYQNPEFVINSSPGIKFDLAEDRDMATKMLSMLVPLLMFALLASACMAVAPESIAGEKERGTMATMLITPIKRWHIAIGKIISLTVFALLSGLSSFIGVILSLPKLMGGFLAADVLPYGVGDYFMLFGLIISIVLVIISAFSVLSALAKSVKEAGSLITPLMMVIVLLGVVSMFVSATPALGLFAIPLVGSGLAISGIMALTATPLAVTLAIISNVVVAAALVVLLAFMFRSERIMFKK